MAGYLTRRAHRARLVRDLLRARIVDGRYHGGPLPSEEQVAVEFAVGRNVVREALGMLVTEGLLRRDQGIGTRARTHVLVHELNSLRAIAEDGAGPDAQRVSYRHLAWDEVPAAPAVADELGLMPGSRVLLWERLTQTGEPIVLWSSYLPTDLGLTRPADVTPTAGGGTFAYLEQHGVRIGIARVRTGATLADPAVAEALDVRTGAPIMVQHRRTLTPEGRVIELATGYYRHDRIYLLNDYGRTTTGSGMVELGAPADERVADPIPAAPSAAAAASTASIGTVQPPEAEWSAPSSTGPNAPTA
jgi:GntR family transcriptional regulator